MLPSQGRDASSILVSRSATLAQWKSSGFVNRRREFDSSEWLKKTMTRLDQHRKKQFTSRIFTVAILLIIIIAFIFFVGIKLLLNASIFISNLTEKDVKNEEQKQEDFYGTINIDSIPVATNSAEIAIEGTALNFDILKVYLNNNKVKEVDVSSERFTLKIGNLEDGENEIYIIAEEEKNNEKKSSKTYIVIYKKSKPKLEINEPENNSKTSKNEVNVIGETEKETEVRINGFPVVIDANLTFEKSVKLSEGENTIEVEAEDIAGNIEKKEIKIIYEKD